MSRIREIRALSKGRVLLFLEEGSSFPLYKKEVAEFALREGEEIPAQISARIFDELLPKRARSRALHLLGQMDRTEAQLREKLCRSCYPPEIVEDAISYVKSFHYIDDLRYARSYLREHAASKSLRQMKQELCKKGISGEITEQAAAEAEAEGELPDEETQIRILLEKKQYAFAGGDRKEQQRIYAFLARRGFGASAIRHVMNEMGGEISERCME